MGVCKRRIHGGLVLAGGLLTASLSVLILGAARGQATDAGLAGSTAARFTLPDAAGRAETFGKIEAQTDVLIVAEDDDGLGVAAGEIRHLCDALGHDRSVRVLGVQVSADNGLFAPSSHAAGVLERECPQLHTLLDHDGSVARAYRVTDVPTAFVVDDHGVLRARVPLNHEGAAVAIDETVNSLRPARPVLGSSETPALPR